MFVQEPIASSHRYGRATCSSAMSRKKIPQLELCLDSELRHKSLNLGVRLYQLSDLSELSPAPLSNSKDQILSNTHGT